MLSEKATNIPLEVWQDPQGQVVLHTSERECVVYFGCWNEDGGPADYLAKVTFIKHLSARFVALEFNFYVVDEPSYKSEILVVSHSKWLNEYAVKRRKLYPNWNSDNYKHFVVDAHDSYIEILALDFHIEKVYRQNAGKLAYLIDEA